MQSASFTILPFSHKLFVAHTVFTKKLSILFRSTSSASETSLALVMILFSIPCSDVLFHDPTATANTHLQQ
jgi:hypothetical protein